LTCQPENIFAGIDLFAEDEDERSGGARFREGLPDVEGFLLNEGVAQSLNDELADEDHNLVGTNAHRDQEPLERIYGFRQTMRCDKKAKIDNNN
jgi:hypothetical protein